MEKATNFSNVFPNANATSPPYEPKFDVKFHTSLLAISFVIITTNILVIALFMTKEALRKGGKLLLCSLAISDLTTGLITIPLHVACETTYSLALCVSSTTLNRFIATSTIYHILAITFETYYAILRPMEHHVNIARSKLLGIVSGIWTAALLLAVTPIIWRLDLGDVRNLPTEEFRRKQSVYEIVVFFVVLIVPVALMVFAYVRMFSKIIQVLKIVRRRTLYVARPSNVNTCKTALLFAIILAVFIFSWSFWFVSKLVKILSEERYPIPFWALDCLTILRYSTSFINPLLYTFFRPDFHKAVKMCLKKTLWQRQSSTSGTYLLGTGLVRRETVRNSPNATTEAGGTGVISASASLSTSISRIAIKQLKYDTTV